MLPHTLERCNELPYHLFFTLMVGKPGVGSFKELLIRYIKVPEGYNNNN